MRILRTIESFYPFVSGPANQAYQISSRLAPLGYDSEVYTTDFGAEHRPLFELIGNVGVTRFTSELRFMKYCYTPAMKLELQDNKFDLVHIHNYRNYQADLATQYARAKNIPYIVSPHGALFGYSKYLKGVNKLPYRLYDIIAGKYMMKKASAVVVSSVYEEKEAINFGIDPDKIHTIPMGVDINEYSAKRRDKDRLTLLFVGNVSPNRNLEPVIRAMKNIDKRIILRIVGPEAKSSSLSSSGYINKLKALAVKEMVSHRITFVGPKYGNLLTQEYNNADIFIYTSLSENFGQTILEAGASGLPIVSTPVGVASDLVRINRTGFFVGWDDPEGVAEEVNNLLNYNTRKKFGDKIRYLVALSYNWDSVVKQYCDLYDKLSE